MATITTKEGTIKVKYIASLQSKTENCSSLVVQLTENGSLAISIFAPDGVRKLHIGKETMHGLFYAINAIIAKQGGSIEEFQKVLKDNYKCK